ncbi:unnamed protein product [Amaranthus hypochondriacus]
MPPKSNNGGNRSLPKFGEWDVNNPQSAEGFTLIFNTARDQKKNDKINPIAGPNQSPSMNNQNQKQKDKKDSKTKKWFSCIFG